MALVRKNPEVLPTTLKLVRGGETETLKVDYRYMKTSEFNTLVEGVGKQGGTMLDALIRIVLGVVASFPDQEYPLTEEGLTEMNDERPGMLDLLITGFQEARGVQRAKN